MHSITRRQHEILEIALANGGTINRRQAGATELNALVQMGCISVAPEGEFKIASAGAQAVSTPPASN